MLRARCVPTFSAVVLIAIAAAAPRARAAEPSGAITEVPLPGGLRAALAAIDDHVAADRSHFLLEFIRRTYPNAARPSDDERDAPLRTLLVHLDLAARRPALTGAAAPPETLPLPLSPEIWIDVVFGGRASPQTLVAEILRSRGPSLLYYGLLALDDETRGWLATKPELIRDLAADDAPGFAVAAPGLRVRAGVVRVPGGELARSAWEALVGRPSAEPTEFIRAIVATRERRVPYFFASMAQLTPAQLTYALNLQGHDEAARLDAMRRMHATFERIAPGWRIDDRTFWRPAADPVLLLTELAADAEGRPLLPGNRRFWAAAFDDESPLARGEDPAVLVEGAPVDFVWLCEQVFAADQRRRYPMVPFASRIVRHVTAESALDAIDAVRAVRRFPALAAALERANVTDVAVIAAAARRAARLSSIDDRGRAFRAIAQFQASLAMLTRAARRGGLPAGALPPLVTSLSAVELSARGEYEGRLVRWLEGVLSEWAAGGKLAGDINERLEGDLVRFLARMTPPEPMPAVEWEGTRYQVDLEHAEALRLVRLLGEYPRPYLSSARALVDAADALTAAGLTRERLAREVEGVERVARNAGGEFEAPLQRLARDADLRGAARLADALRRSADAMLTRGLLEFTYAAALGHPDRAAIAASEAAGRHAFGLELGAIRRSAPWRLPASGRGFGQDWHISGSLLGLDVRLAEFSLVAVSLRPPVRRPSIPEEERRLFIETVALLEPAALTNADRDTIVTALRRGRERLAAVRTAADAAAVADEVRLTAARRGLLVWAAAHDPGAVPAFLSYGELLRLGRGAGPLSAALHAWGAPAEPRAGCLCLQLFDGRTLEILEGRWNSGMLASAFPDLNLRIAELLAELRMPAALVPAVLGPATLDFVNTAECRDPDDRRGLLDFVRGLAPERVEQYLALLTTDGPLVPMTERSSEVAR